MKTTAAAILFVASLLGSTQATAQPPASAPLAQFDAAAIKLRPPTGGIPIAGFLSYPGGRITYAGNAKMLIWFAYGLQDYQVAGGPDWIASDRFDITAVPPDSSPSRSNPIHNAEPTAEQRQMLQSLLRDRFALQCHFEIRQGEVYLLTRGAKPLQFVPPAHPSSDPRSVVVAKQGGIYDGEAGGNNTTTDYLATRLSSYLRLPVLNQTGITGSWDFHLDPVDRENKDVLGAVYSVVDRLGLKIKRGRGPIQTLVIDHIDHPTMN
ncbi:MAG TPA: TIGR03435 family protein [Acidobacteriaceae bacterium]|nr:TIGR03435 family protein [Acidobacteriaceae bacterium]